MNTNRKISDEEIATDALDTSDNRTAIEDPNPFASACIPTATKISRASPTRPGRRE